MSDSLANAVEILAVRLAPGDSAIEARRALLQLVSNYRQRRDAAAVTFRVFKRIDATLPGGEIGAAVWLCSSETVDTFGIVVSAAAAAHFEVGARFKLVPE